MFSEHAMQVYIQKMEEDGVYVNTNKFSDEATGADQLEKSKRSSSASKDSNSEMNDVVFDKTKVDSYPEIDLEKLESG